MLQYSQSALSVTRESHHAVVPQAGGLDGLRKDPAKLKAAVEFATACGAFVTTKPGAIDAQPSQQEAEHLLKTARHA